MSTPSPGLRDRLQYILDSPPRENGGFHPEAVETARQAMAMLDECDRLRAANAELLEAVKRYTDGVNTGSWDYVDSTQGAKDFDALRAAIAKATP